ncbi:MAG: hypothetical protein WCN88_04710 [Candidatus Falkowbacteria bacterium]
MEELIKALEEYKEVIIAFNIMSIKFNKTLEDATNALKQININ